MKDGPPLENVYLDDGRQSLQQLYDNLLKLDSKWIKEIIYWQKIEEGEIPVLAFRTKRKGKALWLFSGIHGEEPAGPNAISKSIDIFTELERKKIPMVIIPMCNPIGYLKNWRYPNEYRNSNLGASVGDSEHLLLNNDSKSRRKDAISNDDDSFTKAIIRYLEARPPILLIDFHEDEDLKGADAPSYIFSQGKLGIDDPIAQMVVSILNDHKVVFKENGRTRFNDVISNGIVNPLNDGSVDELLVANEIYINGVVTSKHSCHSVIVVETPTVDVPLKKRVRAHKEIIQNLENFYLTVQR